MSVEDKTKNPGSNANPNPPVEPIAPKVEPPVVEPVTPPPESSKNLNPGVSSPEIDPLAVGKKFKKVGEFVVDAAFDPTLSPQYKDLNNQVIALTQKSEAERVSMTEQLDALKLKLTDKKDIEQSEKVQLQDQISSLQVSIDVAKKDAAAANVQLLKIQTASSQGLPYNYVSYVSGETLEEIEISVKKVLDDFKVQTNKFTQAELDAASQTAAEKAKTDTEEALKSHGISTDGAGGDEDHIYTRQEISVMDMTEYAKHRDKIQEQESKGLIK